MSPDLQDALAELPVWAKPIVRFELNRLEDVITDKSNQIKKLVGLLEVAKCPACEGAGYTIETVTVAVPGCCGEFNRDGSCCGNPVPVPEQEAEPVPCQWCAEKAEILLILNGGQE